MEEGGSHMSTVDIEVEAEFEAVVVVVAEAVVETVFVGAGPKEQHNYCREPVLDFQNKSQKNKDTPALL